MKQGTKRIGRWGILFLALFSLIPVCTGEVTPMGKISLDQKEVNEAAGAAAANSTAGMKQASVRAEDKLRVSWLARGNYENTYNNNNSASKGFLPVEYVVENLSPLPRSLQLSFYRSYNETNKMYTKYFDVPPMGSARVLAFVPMGAGLQSDSLYGFNGILSDRITGATYVRSNVETPASQEDAFFLGTVPDGFHKDALSALSDRDLFVTSFSPMDVPADPRFYSSMDAFFLEQKDLDAMDRSHKTALLEWVNGGGTLLVNNLDKTRNAEGQYGSGRIKACSVDTQKTESMKNFYKDSVGGKKKARGSLTPCESMLTDGNAESYAMNLPAGTSLFLIAFVILVGPVNLWVFAPKAHRQRLFWTMPLISLGGSLILIVYILAADGFGGKGERVALVRLSPDSPSALVAQSQISKTGILTASDFPLDEFTLLAVEKPEVRRRTASWVPATGGYCDGKMAYGYFASRSGMRHHLLRYVPTRAQVSLVSAEVNGAPVVQTTLPVALKEFVYRDKSGKDWVADSVPPGTKVPLKPSPGDTKAVNIGAGEFQGTGGASELAPINTLPSISWKDKVVYQGRVHVQ